MPGLPSLIPAMWQYKPEIAAAPQLRSKSCFASHPRNCFLHYGQAQPRAWIYTLGMNSSEQVEDPAVMLWRNADAIVADTHSDQAAGALALDSHARRFAGGDEFQSIPQQISKALDEIRLVPIHDVQRVLDLKALLFSTELRGLLN